MCEVDAEGYWEQGQPKCRVCVTSASCLSQDTHNQSISGVRACSFGCSLGAVAVRSCLFFSPWTEIGVWRVKWDTWGQKRISNVIIESKCSFIEANLGLIGSNSFMFDQSNQSNIIVVLLLIKNLDLKKSDEISVDFHRLGKAVVLQLCPYVLSRSIHLQCISYIQLEYTSSVKCMFLNSDYVF